MSGQQAGAIVGQVVGSYFGPVGSAIGGAIGGFIGSQFDPDIINQGPRLTDLHVQLSSYGNARPIVYGTARYAGNVFWSSDIRELVKQEEQGKGGPTVIDETFSYEMDVAIGLGEGVALAIERIFANGVLIFDARSTASPATVYANGQWARSTILYPGNETQLPDPTIEADVGVGNCQAYRGEAYIVIEGLQLTVLKTSTLPNFEFVVVREGTIDQYNRIAVVDNISPSYRKTLGGGATKPLPRVLMDQGVVRIANDQNSEVKIYDLDGNPLGLATPSEFDVQRPPTFDGVSAWGFWRMFDGTNAYVTDTLGVLPADLQIGIYSFRDFLESGREFTSFTQFADNRSILGFVRNDGTGSPAGSGVPDEWIRFQWTGGEEGEVLIDDRGPIATAAQHSGDLGAPSAMFDLYSASFGEGDLRTVWNVKGAGDGRVEVRQIDGNGTMQLLHVFVSGGGEPIFDYADGFSNPSIFADNGLAYIVADDSLQIYSRMATIAETGPTLGEVLADLCERSGIGSTERNTASQTQIVDGFVIGVTMTARAAIESLRPAYHFDAVDGDTLKFVNRGGASVTTFEYNDLGAGEGEAAAISVAANIAQETELPSRWNIRYISKDADYQIGAQSARRETTNSQEVMDAQVPVVMTDAYAAEACDINLRDAWASATLRRFTTGVRYSLYEPTDVVTLDDGIYVRTVQLTRRVDRGAMIEWESRDIDAAVFDSNAVGMSITVASQSLAVPGPTDIEMLDLPPLTELPASGTEASDYVAAKGYLPGWSGSAVEISRDNGATYMLGASVSTASVMGVASTALNDFLGGNVFDEASTVRVAVGNGTLSSTTHAAMLGGANAAVIGNEILQFRTAILVSSGIYDLSGFLRGRKGTEWAIDEHAAGERFVMLTTNLRNVPLQLADRTATSLLVRGSSHGTFSGSAIGESFTTQLARLMPYSPVHLTAVRNFDGSWRLTWVRRDRYMNDWSETEVPMSEVSELYDVEIYNVGGELVDTYTDVNNEYLDIPFDVLGGSPTPSSITYSVWQKSAIVGRGFEAQATITQAL